MGGSVREASGKLELERWFAPFLTHLSRAEQRTRTPVYRCGLLGPGQRKCIEPNTFPTSPYCRHPAPAVRLHGMRVQTCCLPARAASRGEHRD